MSARGESADPSIALGQGTGPLRGVKVVEIAGIGPGPHGCMILADLGADVIRIERPDDHELSGHELRGNALGGGELDVLTRGRPSVAMDLKHPAAVEAVLDLVAGADVLVEGMRPGAAERLGLGPGECQERNPALVYARMTGWGQTGPWAQSAGHDLNYVAITGALHGCGQDPARPHFPVNLLGDFGGGSTYLVIGILSALWEARISGQGQVVDAAIVDGTAHLNAMGASMHANGQQSDARATGLLDGGMPFYDIYETADGEHLSVGALEGQFYAELIQRLDLVGQVPDRLDPAKLPELREILTAKFKSRTRAEWCEVFDGTDACVAPILSLTEASGHPHLAARGTLVQRDGLDQPAPAPRFSRTVSRLGLGPRPSGADTCAALQAWGVDPEPLLSVGAVVQR